MEQLNKNNEEYIEKCRLEIKEEVEKEMSNMGLIHEVNGEKVPVFGSVNTKWELEKKLLKEKYNIDWETPAEKNPNMKYD